LVFINALWPFRSPKPVLLRLFGATVGRRVVPHPGVTIQLPWRLRIGDGVWIGQRAGLDSLDQPTIESNGANSQGAMPILGSQDDRRPAYPTLAGPVGLGGGAGGGAGAIVLGGVTVKSHALLAAGSGTGKNLKPYPIYRGNPAEPARPRV